MVKEEFRIINLPESLEDDSGLGIAKYGELSFTLAEFGDEQELDLWVMKHYAEGDSWAKVFCMRVGGVELVPHVLGFWKNEEVLLRSNHGEITLVDLNSRRRVALQIQEEMPHYASLHTYVESLALLDKVEEINNICSDT
ncbi:hypothetical protein REPUB_Repub05bG0057100 [Reevesia pubescens]